MPILSRIAVYPIKALDPVNLDRVSITTVGGLAGDRVYGIVDKHGEYVHGKRTAEVNRLETTFDLEGNYLELGVRGTDKVEKFNLERDRERLEAWLSEYFGIVVRLEAKRGGAQTDSAVYTEAEETGPTIISRATLCEVASWYDGIDPAEMCLRLRPNLVIEGVPPFWEDRLVANGGWQFVIGDVTLKGVLSVPRCVVPTRDPDTGEVYEGFTETFVEKREETLPAWADRATFDGNFFSLMVVAQILEAERDGELRIGDIVELADSATE